MWVRLCARPPSAQLCRRCLRTGQVPDVWRAAGSCLPRLQQRAFCSGGLWGGPLQPQLLAMAASANTASLSEALASAVAPVLDSVQTVAEQEAVLKEIAMHREVESEEDLCRLYDAELEAAQARLAMATEVLEAKLLRSRPQLLHLAVGGADAGALAPPDEADGRDAMLELSPGVGGQEAALFTREMYDMYENFAEIQGWSFDEESFVEATGGGLQSASVRVGSRGSGDGDSAFGVFGWLRFESGVHRVQRIPETDRKGRMQTSGATVVVLPVAIEADVVFEKQDLRFDISKKSSGPGGQSVNSANQAVQVTHLPTGMSVRCTSSQSQMDNRKLALEILRTRLLGEQVSARASFERSERKGQRGTGDRSEKIRTYNFQRDDVIDHRLSKGTDADGLSASDTLFSGGLQVLLGVHRSRARADRLEEAIEALRAVLASAAKAA